MSNLKTQVQSNPSAERNDKHASEPASFPFPFEPYDIQRQFMSALYRVLDDGQVGILESPTGTGKSMSIICASLQWLADHRARERRRVEDEKRSLLESVDAIVDSSSINWWDADHAADKRREEAKQCAKRLERMQLRADERGRIKAKRVELVGPDPTAFSATVTKDEVDEQSDEDLLPDDDAAEKEEEVEEDPSTKIYYCCRTHSQLKQFMEQLRKSPFADSITAVTVGSRQILCVNSSVTALKSSTMINDRCLELKKKKPTKSGKAGCQFYSRKHIETLAEDTLADLIDVEEMSRRGRKATACPYYASRRAVLNADLVVLPYTSLFHRPTREALGIRIDEQQVVIVDEAHNLVDSITYVNSAVLSGAQLIGALHQLDAYLERYRARLNATNLLRCKQLRRVIQGVLKFLDAHKSPAAYCLDVGEFLSKANILSFNCNELLAYLDTSHLTRKLNGFVQMVQRNATLASEKATPRKRAKLSEDSQEAKISNCVVHVDSFLRTLVNAPTDGRIIVQCPRLGDDDVPTVGGHQAAAAPLSQRTVKFHLLNIGATLGETLLSARSLVFAGGTMRPVEELVEQVLVEGAGVERSRIRFHSFAHVVPAENALALCVPSGPSGKALNFTSGRRTRCRAELARLLANVVDVAPAGGIVCFFPSYSYERSFYDYLTGGDDATAKALRKRIELRKLLLREPRESAASDRVMQRFQAEIEQAPGRSGESSRTGCLLFAVVGGKMSEGINFADALCRLVIVVGLPYPNWASVELQEKMRDLDRRVGPSASGGSDSKPSNLYYESLCIKAVNQSIGRAIRHKDDYACMLLLDERYTSNRRVGAALPTWLTLRHAKDFGEAFGAVGSFFRRFQ